MIRDKINDTQDSKNCRIYLNWVPSHSNIHFNDLADRLAKDGSAKDDVDCDFRDSLSITKNNARKYAYSGWFSSLRYSVSDWTSNFLTIKNIDELTNKFTTAFITGHGLFNSYRNRVNLTDDSSCVMCADPSDTPMHALFDCPAFNNLRSRTLDTIEIYCPGHLYKLNKDNWYLFSFYCEEFYETKRNVLFAQPDHSS